MEKSFIVTKESKYSQDMNKHCKMAEQQKIAVKKFFSEKGIESVKYWVSGDGFVNAPFKEYSKKDIGLYIIPTEKDLINFGKMLTKADDNGLQCFRKNSKIGKEFAQRCIDEKVIINLHAPCPRDYFKTLGWNRYGYQQFKYNSDLYIKINSDYLKQDDIPNGFIEIKLSDYYIAKEKYEAEIVNK